MLQIREVSKFFPGVRALDGVSVSFQPGEVHALVGENGAGKSTLIKIICGIYAPDEGEVLIDGEQIHLHTYKDALDRKINLVSQEIQVIPKSTVAENVMLDKIERFSAYGKIDWKRLYAEAQRYIDLVELNLPASMPVGG
ncbi:MAG: sugar ABC transporter ATP-binding protein [Anaerolineales bacterium]|nr:sugar ABC transporter ATP-binding protein [Anaerolineales bacterium]